MKPRASVRGNKCWCGHWNDRPQNGITRCRCGRKAQYENGKLVRVEYKR